MLLYYFYQYEVSITESTTTTTSNQPSLNESTHTDNVPTSIDKPPLYAELTIGTHPIAPPTNSIQIQYGALVGHRNKVSYIQLVYILYCIIY